MIPEWGLFALILSFCLCILQVCLPLIGLLKNYPVYLKCATTLVLGQAFLVWFSILILVYALVTNDFSVAYVAAHSNTSLPLQYKITALWGGHEGSLLLWVGLLSLWTLAVSLKKATLPPLFFNRVMIILGIISACFLLFLLATSNPFWRLLPNYPIDGRDLNPLLQDIGLIVHPPLLYLGYVGFSIPFAYAIAALFEKDTTVNFEQWMRPWTLLAFGFLTIGITLGSWWAYYELGWGGWWFWDPVENASFMPWVLGIALIHALMTSDKIKQLRSWTLLLAILTFSLSLLGTFLVRSGLLTSVHAFVSDPSRGMVLLMMISVVIGGSLVIYGLKAKRFSNQTKMELISRESSILISTIFLATAVFAILLGTLFPLIYEMITGLKLSVGFPYFNKVFIPLMLPVLILMPLGTLAKWQHCVLIPLLKNLQWPFWLSVLGGVALPFIFAQTVYWPVVVGVTLGLWIIFGTIVVMLKKIKLRGGVQFLSKAAIGMFLAHTGIAIVLMGIVVVSYYHIEKDVILKPSETLLLGDNTIKFEAVREIEGANYIGTEGVFSVLKNNTAKPVARLYPQKRLFVVQETQMTETAIDPGFFRDIYIALGQPLKDGYWSLRVYYKPFVRWIWLGALCIGVGAFLSAWSRFKK